MEENTVIVCLRVLKAINKDSHDWYCVNVCLFDSITRLKAYLLERCRDCNFTFGCTSVKEIRLHYSLVPKKGMITLWVDPHLPETKNSLVSTWGKKRKGIVILS